MRFVIAACVAGTVAALLALPAYAAQDDLKVTGRAQISLGDFDIVIGDLGERFDGWDERPTRVRVQVLEGRRTSDHYFDSLPAALFVLREQYGTPRIAQLDVADYTGYGMIDGRQAYYLLDYDEYSRGGLPLVLAFADYRDALDELRYRNGEVLDFEGLVGALYRWADNDRSRIYWRGWDSGRWDRDNWDNAWNSRWDGWGWDGDHGWLRISVDNGNDDRNRNRRERERNDRLRERDRRQDNGNSERDRGERGRDRERGERTRERDRDRGDEQGDNSNGRQRGDGNKERVRDDNKDGGDKGHGNGDGNKGEGKGEGKGGGKGERVRDRGHDQDNDKGERGDGGKDTGNGNKSTGNVNDKH